MIECVTPIQISAVSIGKNIFYIRGADLLGCVKTMLRNIGNTL